MKYLPRDENELVQRRSSFEFYSRDTRSFAFAAFFVGFSIGVAAALGVLLATPPLKECDRNAEAARVLQRFLADAPVQIGPEPTREP